MVSTGTHKQRQEDVNMRTERPRCELCGQARLVQVVRADEVHVGDKAWLPIGLRGYAWVRIVKIELIGDDVEFNSGAVSTSQGNDVTVTR